MGEFQDDEPELAGYEPTEEGPLKSRRHTFIIRFIVLVGIACLVLPGILVAVSVASATANWACARMVAYAVPDATGSSARFELFGPGLIGWECYSVGAFGGDRHVASLGLIPGMPDLPANQQPGPARQDT